jgi:hypothetical protein
VTIAIVQPGTLFQDGLPQTRLQPAAHPGQAGGHAKLQKQHSRAEAHQASPGQQTLLDQPEQPAHAAPCV